jgi:HEAT repeat protein
MKRFWSNLSRYKDKQVALNAIRILLNKEAISILTPCLDDKRPAVRVAAIFALANFERHASGMAGKIRTHLDDPDPEVKRAAEYALEKIEPEIKP